MSNFLSVEFLPIIAIPILGFIFTLKSKNRYVKWIFAATPVLVVAIGIYSEYRCDRSLTNVVVRIFKGVEICPTNSIITGELQADSMKENQQDSSIIIAQAWYIVSQKVPGGSGKAAALEVLARFDQPLQGIDISCLLMGSAHDPSRRRYPCETLTQLEGLDLSQTPNLDMSKVNFEGIQGDGINLSNQDLTLSNFSNSQMPNSDFSNADLWGAIFSGSEVFSVHFEGSDLRGAEFVDSNISSSNFDGANMSSSKLIRVKALKSNLSNVNLQNASFDLSEISYSNFDGANLFRSSFKGAIIVDSSFRGANLSSADFTDAKITALDEPSSYFQGSWAWRNQEPRGLGQFLRIVTICDFDTNIHDYRFRPSDC